MRPVEEVTPRTEVDEAERLEVRDPARTECGLLSGGEPEKELRVVRNQVRRLDAGRLRHSLRQAPPGAKVAADETTANARRLEDLRPAEQRSLSVLDVRSDVAA